MSTTDTAIAKRPRRSRRVPRSIADLLHGLGDIAAERVRLDPPPGTATFDDLIAANEAGLAFTGQSLAREYLRTSGLRSSGSRVCSEIYRDFGPKGARFPGLVAR